MNERILTTYFRRYLIENDINFIEQVPFRYKKIDIVIFKQNKIISLELKVSDWKSALHQAGQNLFFSNKSYIGIWYKFKNRLDIDFIREFNIGLYLIKKNSVLEILKPLNHNKYLKPEYYKSFKEKLRIIYNDYIFRN